MDDEKQWDELFAKSQEFLGKMAADIKAQYDAGLTTDLIDADFDDPPTLSKGAALFVKTYDELKSLIEQRGVHAEFGDAGEGWAIEQNPHELAAFLTRMQELGVQSVLEIGTGYKGGLSRFLAQDMGWDVTTYDIKNYGHIFTGVHYIVGDETWANVEYPHFLEKFDLVFIDANHAYDEVKFDYEYYGKYAAKAIAFHDIAGLRDCEGVKQFWKEAQELHFSHCSEVVDKGNRRSGIGLIEL